MGQNIDELVVFLAVVRPVSDLGHAVLLKQRHRVVAEPRQQGIHFARGGRIGSQFKATWLLLAGGFNNRGEIRGLEEDGIGFRNQLARNLALFRCFLPVGVRRKTLPSLVVRLAVGAGNDVDELVSLLKNEAKVL